MTADVDWAMAQRIAARVGGEGPFSGSYHHDRLDADFAELTEQAEELVAETTGLRPHTRARARVIDRSEWVAVNTSAFGKLLGPLLDKLDEGGPGLLSPVTSRLAGAEMGLVLGWMSKRVLGQYDLLLTEDEDEDADVVYYVGPNVVAIEKRFAFPPREFRLWLALHELTHRAQFTAVPWMRHHFVGLVSELMDGLDPDPDRIMAGLRRAVEARRSGDSALADGGLAGLFASEDQRQIMDRISGMMSLLEGHGDVTMTRAAGDRVPSAERFARVLAERRRQSSGSAKLFQRLIGIEAKLAQYEQGEAFLAAIEAERGERAVDAAWERPEALPTLDEIREPRLWLERVAVPDAA